ncbi:MAG: PBP1A family penicillin-binding protein [Myxococcota bacterium]
MRRVGIFERPATRWVAIVAIGLLAAALLGLYTLRSLQAQVEARFQGRLFAVPSRVYAAPVELYPGCPETRPRLLEDLERIDDRRVESAREVGPGEYFVSDREIVLGRRPFRGPGGADSGGLLRIRFAPDGSIESLEGAGGRALAAVQLRPERIAELYGPGRQDRRLVRLDEVPRVLVDAVLAIEDQHFREHSGIDWRRIAGAMLANLRAGRFVQGGSTLTQQLVKNFYLTRERTLGRKLREAAMALLLERRHSKDEILQAYLNEVYMGQRGSVAMHGVGEAAREYFGREPSALTLPQAALLSAIIKGPALYSPRLHPEAARQRRNLVLARMEERGSIDRAARDRATAEPLGVRPRSIASEPAPYFIAWLRRDLASAYGDDLLESEGLRIFTTLDARAQRQARSAVRRGVERLERQFPNLGREATPLQAALVAIAPATGEILALVGGRDFSTSQFDRVTQARRQPGSVFKPIVALAALGARDASGRPFTLASQLEDAPLEVDSGGRLWRPVNYDGRFRGPVTLRRAIEESLNVPTARLGLAIGPQAIVRTARKLGIQSPLEPVPSLALGAFEVSLLEITRAYAVIAADGVLPVLRSYSEVLDADGRRLEHQPIHFTREFDARETWLVTSILRGAVEHGTARSLRTLGYRGPAAGKTGTTNDFRDAWFVGFTPEVVVGVWVGFDDGSSLGVPGSVAALPIFADFLKGWVGPEGRGEFHEPAGIERVQIDPLSGLRAGAGCRGAPELFLPGTAPTARCDGSEAGGRTPPLERLLHWFRGQG